MLFNMGSNVIEFFTFEYKTKYTNKGNDREKKLDRNPFEKRKRGKDAKI